jgi:site-specific recombinase XerD
MSVPTTVPLGSALRAYFCSYLIGQRDLSPRTIASYRDTFRLFLQFLDHRYHIQADALCVEDLDAPRVLAFLADLEKARGNCVRSRNARLAAIRSFLRRAAAAEPLVLPVAQRVLAIPMKRFDRVVVGHLTGVQIQAILDAPDGRTPASQRDRLLLLLLYNTGARVSEITALQCQDVCLESSGSVHLRGKGRKHRSVPLWRDTVKLLRLWLRRPGVRPESPLLPNARGAAMTRSGVAQRLRLAVTLASAAHPDLRSTRVSPHTIRHTTAAHLLQSGTDLADIAMWLGHESIQTTHQYLDADLESKRQALARLEPPRVRRNHLRPAKPLMQFLKGL